MNKPSDCKLRSASDLRQNKMVLFTDASNLNSMYVEQVDFSTIVDPNVQNVKRENGSQSINATKQKEHPGNDLQNIKREASIPNHNLALKNEKTDIDKSSNGSRRNQIFCFCGEEFETYLDCKIHHREAHETPKKKDEFKCVLCHQILGSDDILNKHMMDVHYITSQVRKDTINEKAHPSQIKKFLKLDNENSELPNYNALPTSEKLKADQVKKSEYNGNSLEIIPPIDEIKKPLEGTNNGKMLLNRSFTIKRKVETSQNSSNLCSSKLNDETYISPIKQQITDVTPIKLQDKICSTFIDKTAEFSVSAKKSSMIIQDVNRKLEDDLLKKSKYNANLLAIIPAISEIKKPPEDTNNNKILISHSLTTRRKVGANQNSSNSNDKTYISPIKQRITDVTPINLQDKICSTVIDKTAEFSASAKKPPMIIQDVNSCFDLKAANSTVDKGVIDKRNNSEDDIVCLTKSNTNQSSFELSMTNLNKNSILTSLDSRHHKTLHSKTRNPNELTANVPKETSNSDIEIEIEIEEITPEIVSVVSTPPYGNHLPASKNNEERIKSNVGNHKRFSQGSQINTAFSKKSRTNSFSNPSPITDPSFHIRKTAQGGGICQLCGLEFLHYSSCKTHYKNKHGENSEKKNYFCLVCEEGFTFEINLTSHMKKIHYISSKLISTTDYGGKVAKIGNGGGVCLICCKQYQHYSSCKAHFAEKHLNNGMQKKNMRPDTSGFCQDASSPQQVLKTNARFVNVPPVSKTYLPSERKDALDSLSNSSFIGFGEGEEYLCTFCIPPKKFTEILSYEKHHSMMHSIDSSKLTCSVCYQKFSNEMNLSSHMKHMHGVNSTLNTQGKQGIMGKTMRGEVVCMICGEKFTERSTCKKHIKLLHEKYDTTTDEEIEVYDNFVDVSKISQSSNEWNSNQNMGSSTTISNVQLAKNLHSHRSKSHEQDLSNLNENISVGKEESIADIIRQIKEEKRRANSEG